MLDVADKVSDVFELRHARDWSGRAHEDESGADGARRSEVAHRIADKEYFGRVRDLFELNDLPKRLFFRVRRSPVQGPKRCCLSAGLHNVFQVILRS